MKWYNYVMEEAVDITDIAIDEGTIYHVIFFIVFKFIVSEIKLNKFYEILSYKATCARRLWA